VAVHGHRLHCSSRDRTLAHRRRGRRLLPYTARRIAPGALHVARRRRVDAVVISVHRCHGEALPRSRGSYVNSRDPCRRAGLAPRPRIHRNTVRSARRACERPLIVPNPTDGGDCGPRWSSGVARCHADPRTAGPCPRRAIRRGAALLRSNRALAPALSTVRVWPGISEYDEHADVALSSSVHSVTQELPRGHASAARLLSVSESRVVGLDVAYRWTTRRPRALGDTSAPCWG